MDLTLLRTDFRSDGILGELGYLGMPVPLYTLEHAYADMKPDGRGLSPYYRPKLPTDIYTCQKSLHKLHDGVPFLTFEVKDVPGHKGILFHIGNVNADSEGCILVGMKQDTNSTAILQSRIAFKAFMDLQKGCETFTLTVLNG